MKHQDPIAVLEIGTTHITLTLGEPLGQGRIRVIARADVPSVGVRKSCIIDMKQVSFAIETAIKNIAHNFNWTVGTATLIVSGPHITMTSRSHQIAVDGGSVTEETMRALNNHAWEEASSSASRTLLDLSETGYSIGELTGIVNPCNMTGHLLTLHALGIDASTDRVEDARKAAEAANLQLSDEFLFAGTCAAAGVLSEEDKEAGTLVIDLGGGCTSWSLHCDGRLAYASVLGVGGDHVTSDIAQAFTLPQATAEQIKPLASATLERDREGTRIDVPATITGSSGNTISSRALDTVVNARMRELFTIIRDDLEKAGALHLIRGGIILTGGGSALNGAAKLCETIFGSHTRLGQPIPEVEGLEKAPFPPSVATVAGALSILAQQYADETPDDGGFASFFGKFFK